MLRVRIWHLHGLSSLRWARGGVHLPLLQSRYQQLLWFLHCLRLLSQRKTLFGLNTEVFYDIIKFVLEIRMAGVKEMRLAIFRKGPFENSLGNISPYMSIIPFFVSGLTFIEIPEGHIYGTFARYLKDHDEILLFRHHLGEEMEVSQIYSLWLTTFKPPSWKFFLCSKV